jgi:competence protein ComK
MVKELYMVENYRVGRNTMALLSYRDPQFQTKILDVEGGFKTREPAKDLLHKGCIEDSSTYYGRSIATIYFTSYVSNSPILISQVDGVIAVPIYVHKQETCCWLFLQHLAYVEKISINRCLVVFTNQDELELNVPATTVYEQVKKAGLILIRHCSKKQFNFTINPKSKQRRIIRNKK